VLVYWGQSRIYAAGVSSIGLPIGLKTELTQAGSEAGGGSGWGIGPGLRRATLCEVGLAQYPNRCRTRRNLLAINTKSGRPYLSKKELSSKRCTRAFGIRDLDFSAQPAHCPGHGGLGRGPTSQSVARLRPPAQALMASHRTEIFKKASTKLTSSAPTFLDPRTSIQFHVKAISR